MPDQHDESKGVRLGDFPSEVEAMMIASGLNERGIEARVVGGATAGFRAEAPGRARVLVHADELKEALRLVEEIRRDAEDIDWEQVDLGEMED